MSELRISGELASVLADFDKWVEQKLETSELPEKTDSPLYHYTDVAGLEGIVKNEELWLTSTLHLNDPTEAIYGIKLAVDEMNHQSQGRHRAISLMCEMIQNVLDRPVARFAEFFITSLSSDGDELGQWRGYGDDGRGVSIGIDHSVFIPKSDDPSAKPGTPSLATVTYDKDEAKRKQAEVVERAIEAFEFCIEKNLINAGEQAKEFAMHLSVQMSLGILWNSITTKHPAYRHEKEIRLVLARSLKSTTPPIETRLRGVRNLVPFVRLKLPIRAPGIIKKIVIGPAAAPDLEDGIAHFLRSVGIAPEGLIHKSDIPYRCR